MFYRQPPTLVPEHLRSLHQSDLILVLSQAKDKRTEDCNVLYNTQLYKKLLFVYNEASQCFN